jgi:hypothetical protein
MKEGNGDGKKLISDGNRTGYNESDEGGSTTPLQKEALAFGFLKRLKNSCLQIAHPKTM